MTDIRRIDEIEVGPRFRKDFGDIEGLAAWIAMDGLIEPIVVTPDGRLLAGHRRLRACQMLGWTDIPVSIKEESRAGS